MKAWFKQDNRVDGEHSILCTLQWRNARLRQPRKYRIAIVQTTDDKSSDQTGSRLHAQDASNSFQATNVKVANADHLAYVRFHYQFIVQSYVEVANAGNRIDDVISDVQCETRGLHRLQIGFGAKLDDFSFRRIQLQSSGRRPPMNGLDALLQTKDGGSDVSDSRCLHQLLRIVGVQLMTKMKTINETCQLLCVSDELL
jgi:hypothetical protein